MFLELFEVKSIPAGKHTVKAHGRTSNNVDETRKNEWKSNIPYASSKEKKALVKGVRSHRGVNVDKNHYMVLPKVNQIKIEENKNRNRKNKWNLRKLEDDEV